MLAYDCVPPFEAVSADAPQAIADSDADGIVVLESVDREQVLVDPLDFQQAYKHGYGTGRESPREPLLLCIPRSPPWPYPARSA